MSDSLQHYGLQPTRLLCPWDSPGKNTGVGCHALLQGTFPTQKSNWGLPHCTWILYRLSQESPKILEWVAYPFPGELPNPGTEPESLSNSASQALLGLLFLLWLTPCDETTSVVSNSKEMLSSSPSGSALWPLWLALLIITSTKTSFRLQTITGVVPV